MSQTHTLSDISALQMHRARANSDALFLQEAAADEIQDRLEMINRPFKSVAIISPYPEIWQNRFKNAQILPETDVVPLATQTYDLVIHAMGLHWSNDPVGQLIQCRRALIPDGLMIAATLGGQTLHELRSCLGQAEIAVSGGLSPRVAPMGEVRDLGALLQRAGLALPVADTAPLRAEYKDIWHLMHDLRAMGETNALVDRRRSVPQRALFEQAGALYHQHFKGDKGRIIATYEMVFMTGWAPSETQQKPLRPGSAKQRLADALSVPENRLPD